MEKYYILAIKKFESQCCGGKDIFFCFWLDYKTAPRAKLARGALSVYKASKTKPVNHFPLHKLVEL